MKNRVLEVRGDQGKKNRNFGNFSVWSKIDFNEYAISENSKKQQFSSKNNLPSFFKGIKHIEKRRYLQNDLFFQDINHFLRFWCQNERKKI